MAGVQLQREASPMGPALPLPAGDEPEPTDQNAEGKGKEREEKENTGSIRGPCEGESRITNNL